MFLKQGIAVLKNTDQTLGSTDKRFEGNVDFVRIVKTKSKIKTNIIGTITYQVCTDEECLAPKTVSFNLKIE